MNYNQNIHHRRSIRLKGYDYSQAGAYFITICCQEKEVSTFGEIVDGKMILNAYGTIAYNEWGNTPNVRNNVELDVFVIMPNHIHGIIILNDNPRRKELHSQNNGRGELHSPNLTDEFENLKGDFESPRRFSTGFKSPKGTVGSIVRGFKSSVTKQINTYNRTIESISTNACRGELHSPSENMVLQNKCRDESISKNKCRDESISTNTCRGELHSPSDNTVSQNIGRGELHSPNSGNKNDECNSQNLKGECNSTNLNRECNSGNKKGECNSPLRIWQRDYYEHIIRNDKSYQRISDYIINNPENWTDDKFGDLEI